MGHIMEALEDAERLLCKGIEEINKKGELNASSLDMLGSAVDAYKDIVTIREKEMGGSYGRRRRDSMGRFMDDGYGRRYYDDYEYRDGHVDGGYREDRYREDRYRKDNEERERLERKMRNAQSEQERDMYRRMLDNMS